MTIKETFIKTKYIQGLDTFNIPVLYTDELVETSVYDLAYSAVHDMNLPYLFIGYFKNDNQKIGKWYIANARRHCEMEKAIIEDIGKVSQYTHGQISFISDEQEKGRLIIDQVILSQEISENEKDRIDAITELLSKLNNNILNDNIVIKNIQYDGWSYMWKKDGRTFEKIK